MSKGYKRDRLEVLNNLTNNKMLKEQIEEITEKSGLICMGIDEAGDIQWMGDIKNWRIGEPLIYKANLED